MDSYMETLFPPHHEEPQQPGNNSSNNNNNTGLLRFRSAPSSVFNDYIGDEFSESEYERKPQGLNLNSQNGYSGLGSGLGSGQLPPPYPKQGVDQGTRQGNGGGGGGGTGGGLNLSRQSSSPAGFFNQINPQNGYTIMRGLGSFRVGNGTKGESSPRSSRLSMSHLPLIPEIGNESVKETSPDGTKFRTHEDDIEFDSPAGFSFASWSESGSDATHLSENGGLAGRPNALSHHLSLPKTSAEMAAVEKLLHFQDTIPCKIRAKRGCATHPRSIAERVRRNRISERMRKLQDLVPNMDKQTNTADMLDLAVDYIKNLQSQYKVLSDNRAKCKCVNLQ